MKIYFSDFFDVNPDTLDAFGAFNISLINDLPLFIDPFLLFASEKKAYQDLHEEIITYLIFLRGQSTTRKIAPGLLRSWYCFPEVKQLWLGFSKQGNRGTGLGLSFATALNENLNAVFRDFGNEKITLGTHLEKVCLIADGVGRDNISDFTANLVRHYLCEYTEAYAKAHVAERHRRSIRVPRIRFNYQLEVWTPETYELPWAGDDYVLLAPRDILTQDENWINRNDLVRGLARIAQAIPDNQLREQLGNYIRIRLHEKMKESEKQRLYAQAIKAFPQVIEHYIRSKEDKKAEARTSSELKVSESENFYIAQLGRFIQQLDDSTEFYRIPGTSYEEARARIAFLKEEIENNGGYRIFYKDGKPIQRESDLQILFRLTWYATPSDFNSEVDNGRGPVDFKISRGDADKTIVEFKLARNSKLKKNLAFQVEIYERANRTQNSLKVIFYFSEQELLKVQKVIKELGLKDNSSVILIDVRNDNKPSASKATR